MTRYHPLLVFLHWLLAIMIIAGLVTGHFVLSKTPNADPEKLFMLGMHMSVGGLILLLMVIRLFVRVKRDAPPPADIGNAMFNRLGVVTHWLFYALVFVMALSGIGISVLAGLPEIVFFGVEGEGTGLPASFDDLPPRWAHGLVARLLALLIIAHVAAALYHHFIRKDGLMRRMWFAGK